MAKKKSDAPRYAVFVALIGGLMLFYTGINYITYIGEMNSLLSQLGWTFQTIGADPNLLNTRMIATITLGLIGAIGGAIMEKKRKIGAPICIIIGIIAVVGLFLPIGNFVMDFPSPYNQYDTTMVVTLNGSFLLIDPFLIVIGGLIGFFVQGGASGAVGKTAKKKKPPGPNTCYNCGKEIPDYMSECDECKNATLSVLD